MGMLIKKIMMAMNNAIVTPLITAWSTLYKSVDIVNTAADTVEPDLGMSTPGTDPIVRGRIAYASGKRYFEVDIPALGDYNQCFVGLVDSSIDVSGIFDNDAIPPTGKYFYQVYEAAGGPHYHGIILGDDYANDIALPINFPLRICVAVDFDTGNIWMKEASQLFVKREVEETTTPWDAANLTAQPPSFTFTPGTALYPAFSDSSGVNTYSARFVLSDFSEDANQVSNIPAGFTTWYDTITQAELDAVVEVPMWDAQNYVHNVQGGEAAIALELLWYGEAYVAENAYGYGETLESGAWYLPSNYDINGQYEVRFIASKISGVDATLDDNGYSLDWAPIRPFKISVFRSGGEGEGTTASSYEIQVQIRNVTSKAILSSGTYTVGVSSEIPGV